MRFLVTFFVKWRVFAYSVHFWELSTAVLEAIVVWDLECNGCFGVQSAGDELVVLSQTRGLPIAGAFRRAWWSWWLFL